MANAIQNFKYTKHPHINHMLRLYAAETVPFRKIHRMLDVFETIIKTHTAYIISDYFKQNNISDDIKGLLAEGLKAPSLGVWQFFSREIVKSFMKEDTEGEKLFIKGFSAYFEEWDKLAEPVITIRNIYAHGATPEDEICLEDIDKFEPILLKMLESEFLNETSIVVFEKLQDKMCMIDLEDEKHTIAIKNDSIESSGIIPQKPYLIRADRSLLCLSPIMLYKNKLKNSTKEYSSPSIVFFNDLKAKNKVTLLNYPHAMLIKDKESYNEFSSTFNIKEWKGKITDPFKEKIRKLMDNFKGRYAEKNWIKNAAESGNTNILLIHGVPGIGKSALAANIEDEFTGTGSFCIKYFIQRNTSTSELTYFLDYMYDNLEKIKSTGIPKGKSPEEKKKNFFERMAVINDEAKNNKLIIIIDGLEEAEQEFFKCLNNVIYDNILIIYFSRFTDKVEQFYNSLPFERKSRMELKGLYLEDIRAMLFEVASKYEIENSYIEEILNKSEGNPLYVKLVCNYLSDGTLKLNDTAELKNNLYDFFKDLIERLSFGQTNDNVLNALYVITVAKDFINQKQLEIILGISTVESEKVLRTLQEVLKEDPLREGYYQLFHESFRDYLIAVKKDFLINAEMRIINYCRNWKNQRIFHSTINLYIAKYYVTHLEALGLKEEIMGLVHNDEYIDFQLDCTGQYSYTFYLYNTALNISKNNIRESVHISVKMLQLYIMDFNSADEILKLVVNENSSSFEQSLERVKNFIGKKQLILYINMLHYVYWDENLNTQEKKSRLDKLMQAVDKNVIKDLSIEDWSDFIPAEYMVKLLKDIESLGVSIKPLTDRASIDISKITIDDNEDGRFFSLLPNDLKEKLKSEDYKSILSKMDNKNTHIKCEKHKNRELYLTKLCNNIIELLKASGADEFSDLLKKAIDGEENFGTPGDYRVISSISNNNVKDIELYKKRFLWNKYYYLYIMIRLVNEDKINDRKVISSYIDKATEAAELILKDYYYIEVFSIYFEKEMKSEGINKIVNDLKTILRMISFENSFFVYKKIVNTLIKNNHICDCMDIVNELYNIVSDTKLILRSKHIPLFLKKTIYEPDSGRALEYFIKQLVIQNKTMNCMPFINKLISINLSLNRSNSFEDEGTIRLFSSIKKLDFSEINENTIVTALNQLLKEKKTELAIELIKIYKPFNYMGFRYKPQFEGFMHQLIYIYKEKGIEEAEKIIESFTGLVTIITIQSKFIMELDILNDSGAIFAITEKLFEYLGKYKENRFYLISECFDEILFVLFQMEQNPEAEMYINKIKNYIAQMYTADEFISLLSLIVKYEHYETAQKLLHKIDSFSKTFLKTAEIYINFYKSKTNMDINEMVQFIKAAGNMTKDISDSRAPENMLIAEMVQYIAEQGYFNEALNIEKYLYHTKKSESLGLPSKDHIMLEAGHVDELLSSCDLNTKNFHQIDLLSCISFRLLKRGDLIKASDIIANLNERYMQIDCFEDLITYADKYKNNAVLLDMIDKISNNETRDIFIAMAAKYFTEINNSDIAMDIIERINDEYEKRNAYSQVISVLIKKEQPEKAVEVLDKITDGECIKNIFEISSDYINVKIINIILEKFKNSNAYNVLKIAGYTYLIPNLQKKIGDIEEISKDIISEISFSKSLLQQFLSVFAFYIRYYSEQNNQDKKEILSDIASVIDLPAEMLVFESNCYYYDTINEWIDTIDDEDDREYIELLAKRVQKNKISKEEFNDYAGKLKK